jgi:peptidoglycan/xylan/chitin deacetylase (PgdA/CDA1 family)
LYMNADQIRCMAKAGMYIGSHGYEHRWLDTVSPEEQQTEIQSSLRFLRALGCDLQQWSFNYPYGAHNGSLVSALRASGAGLGFTTKVGIADLASEDPLLLSRLNTNDLPKDNNADPNEWTLKVV